MALSWEAWALGGLGALQFAVAYWWYRGPYLEGTRGWVTALFTLNGLSSIAEAANLAAPGVTFDVATSVTSIGTNVALLAVGLLGLGWQERRPRLHRAVLGIGVLLAAMAAGSRIVIGLGPMETAPIDALNSRVNRSLGFTMAIFAGAAALAYRARGEEEGRNVWMLVLAAVTLRYAELGVGFFNLKRFDPTGRSAIQHVALSSINLWLPAMVAAGLAVAWFRIRGDLEDPMFHDLALLLLVGGALYGLARTGAGIPPLLSFLPINLVRPVAFLGAQAVLRSTPFTETRQAVELWQGGIVYVWVLLGYPASILLGLDPLPAAAVSLGLGVLALGFVLVLGRPRRRAAHTDPTPRSPSPGPDPASGGGGPRNPDKAPDWPLQPDRVSLPEDWEKRVAEGHETYQDLPAETKRRLDDLPRWKRLLLALEAAPDGDRLPPYERTTPGLHLVTHAPYPSIGPEITRTNERAEAILRGLGMDPKRGATRGDEPLFEDHMGPAQGLSSSRAKSYALTDLGETVARHVADEVGLDGYDAETRLAVLGEGYRDGP